MNESGLDWTARCLRSAYGRRVDLLPPTKHDELESMFPCRQKVTKCAAESKSLPQEQKFTDCPDDMALNESTVINLGTHKL